MDDDIILDDWNPTPETLKRWAYDERICLVDQDEDLLVGSREYLSILLPMADDPSCPKAGYILCCVDFFLMFVVLRGSDAELKIVDQTILLTESSNRQQVIDWGQLQKRRLAYRRTPSPVDRAGALKMGQDLLNGICRESEISLSKESAISWEVQLSVPPFHRHREWLTIDKATGAFTFRR